MIARNHVSKFHQEHESHMILLPLLAPLCPVWTDLSVSVWTRYEADPEWEHAFPSRPAHVGHKSAHVCFGGTGGQGNYLEMKPGYKAPKPVWRLITETSCAHDSCYCQIGKPVIEEFVSLAEAVRAFERAEPDETIFREVGPTEPRGTDSFEWFSRSGTEFALSCPFCGQDEGLHWNISLHCPEEASDATRRRVARVLGVLPSQGSPFYSFAEWAADGGF